MKKKLEKMMLLALAIICLVGVWAVPLKANAVTKAKVVLEFTDGTKQTWKTGDEKINIGNKKLAYVYFGSFPQTKVTNKKTLNKLASAKYDKNGITTLSGVRYLRVPKSVSGITVTPFDEKDKDRYVAHSAYIDGPIGLQRDMDFPTFNYQFYTDFPFSMMKQDYVYFKFETIKWRVLSVSGKKAFLLSEYCLDQKSVQRDNLDLRWFFSDLRIWCNREFLQVTFNSKEQKLIVNTKLQNLDNPLFANTSAYPGEDTVDKIFLPSLWDMTNEKYGFESELCEDFYLYEENANRRASATEYALAQGGVTDLQSLTDNGEPSVNWILRTIGDCVDTVCRVDHKGVIYCNAETIEFIRPAMNLNLKNIIE